MPARRSVRLHPARLFALAILLGSCASVRFDRETETSGTFEAKGWSFTIVKVDLPKAAIDIARENAADANLPNMIIEEVVVIPYLGPLDFLLDIISVRYARISGTWGFSGD